MLKKLAITIIIAFASSSFAQDYTVTKEEYDISPAMINGSVHRTKYYMKDTFLGSSLSSEEFIKEANREKPTVIHLHGCSGISPVEPEIRRFYLGLGFNYAETNFLNRGDAIAACRKINGILVVRTNYQKRLPARVLELNAHIDWLKENGFKTIYVVGHSEGGMVEQFLEKKVDGVIIHSMKCIKQATPSSENRYLQLLSTNDPFFDKQGAVSCQGYSGHETFTYAISNVRSHDPFADPSWAGQIKQFLGIAQ